MRKPVPLLFLFLVFLATACKKEKQFSSFNTNILAPLISGELDLGNFTGDSLLTADGDGALTLVYDYELYRARIEDYFQVPDTERVNTLSLQTLVLADQEVIQPVPLFLVYPPALALNGQVVSIPAQTVTNTAPIPVDGSSFFNTATFRSGTMEIKINNGFPVDLARLIFELRNVVDGSVIQTDTFRNVPSGGSQIRTIDLAGKTVYAQMEAVAKLIETDASNGPVLVNSGALALITITAKDMKPESATAKFPAQSVISADNNIVYDLGGAQVKHMKVKSGRVSFRVVSTIQEDMKVDYRIPHAVRDGLPFLQQFTVPAAAPGSNVQFIREYDITGYTIDMRGKNPIVDDTVNSFYNILDVTIDSTGRETSISLNDSVFLYIGLLDIIPEYAEGYFGQQTMAIGPSTIDFDFFKSVSGKLDLEDITLSLEMQNGIGAEADLKINYLTARNSRKGNAVQLSGTPISSVIKLYEATLIPFSPNIQIVTLNPSNSNIKPFVELLPDKLDYSVEIQTNPNGNVNNYRDFITDQSEFVALLGVNIPVSLKADALSLSDTVEFSFGSLQRSENIREGNLNIVCDNGFPMDATLQIYLLNDNNFIIDSLMISRNRISAAPSNPSTYKVIQPLRSVAVAELPPARMSNFRLAKRMIVKATFDTSKTSNNYWKIYNSYKFGFTLTGDFIYEQDF